MGGGHFNLNQATKAISHAASSAGNKALELANPIPAPAEGRSRADQMRTIGRKFGSTVKHTGQVVEKAGDVLSEGSKYVGYAATAGEIVGMGLTAVGQPELGIPLMEASAAVGESDALGAAVLGGPMLQNAGAWMVDAGSTMRNVSKGAEKGVRQEHANQLAITAAGYEYRDNMHKGAPNIPNLNVDNDFLGDRRAIVYTHENNDDVFITYNGTDPSNASDLLADGYILTGNESQSSRFQYAEQLYKDVKEKYPDKNIHLTGHSLGGQEAAYVGCKNRVASVTTFNRGSNPLASDVDNKNCTSNVTNYKTRSDPISTGPYALPKQKLIVLQGSGGFDPHGMHNFNVV